MKIRPVLYPCLVAACGILASQAAAAERPSGVVTIALRDGQTVRDLSGLHGTVAAGDRRNVTIVQIRVSIRDRVKQWDGEQWRVPEPTPLYGANLWLNTDIEDNERLATGTTRIWKPAFRLPGPRDLRDGADYRVVVSYHVKWDSPTGQRGAQQAADGREIAVRVRVQGEPTTSAASLVPPKIDTKVLRTGKTPGKSRDSAGIAENSFVPAETSGRVGKTPPKSDAPIPPSSIESPDIVTSLGGGKTPPLNPWASAGVADNSILPAGIGLASERVDRMVQGLELTQDQNAKLGAIKRKFGPKLLECKKRIDALAPFPTNTPDQRTKLAEARKAMSLLERELQRQVMAVLPVTQQDKAGSGHISSGPPTGDSAPTPTTPPKRDPGRPGRSSTR